MGNLRELARHVISSEKNVHQLSWVASRVDRGKNEVFSEIVEITPDIAKHLLSFNDDNRKISERTVNIIAGDIASGKWRMNGEPIIVAKDGQLNDGQHRLSAIIAANVAVPVMIVFGVERASRFTVNMGRQRTPGDFLGMNGVKNEKLAAAISALLLTYNKGVFSHTLTTGNMSLSKQDVLEEHRKYSNKIQRACKSVFRAKFIRQHAATAAGVAHVVLSSSANHENLEFFFDRLNTGEELRRGSPILMLRNQLISTKQEGLRANNKLEMILRYWNAWIDGRSVRARIKLVNEYPIIKG